MFRNSGDLLSFSEDFHNIQTISKNGGVVANVEISNGVATFNGTSSVITYAKTIKVKTVIIKLTSTTTTEDIIDLDGGTHTLEVGAGTITATGFSSPTIYVDGVVSSTLDTGEHEIAITTATAFYTTTISVGKETTYFDGTMKKIKMFSETLVLEEIIDEFTGDTYSEIDAKKFDVFLPLKTWYNKDGVDQTENLGKQTGAMLWGNGAGSNKPTQLYPNGVSMTSTQYLKMASLSVSSSKDFTFFCGYDFTDISVQTHAIFKLGAGTAYTTDGILISQYSTNLYFYWNSSGISKSVANFFEKGLNTFSISSKGGIVSVYKNGVKIGTDTDLSAKAALNGAYPFYIGYNSSGAIGKILQPVFGFGISATARQIRSLHFSFLEGINK